MKMYLALMLAKLSIMRLIFNGRIIICEMMCEVSAPSLVRSVSQQTGYLQ